MFAVLAIRFQYRPHVHDLSLAHQSCVFITGSLEWPGPADRQTRRGRRYGGTVLSQLEEYESARGRARTSRGTTLAQDRCRGGTHARMSGDDAWRGRIRRRADRVEHEQYRARTQSRGRKSKCAKASAQTQPPAIVDSVLRRSSIAPRSRARLTRARGASPYGSPTSGRVRPASFARSHSAATGRYRVHGRAGRIRGRAPSFAVPWRPACVLRAVPACCMRLRPARTRAQARVAFAWCPPKPPSWQHKPA